VTDQPGLPLPKGPPPLVVEVAVPLPLPGGFHYTVPPSLAERLEVGCAVSVPFGNRRLTGYVLEVGVTPPEGQKLKPVDYLAISEPLFDASLVPLFHWLASYYAHPLGEVVRTALPGSTRSSSRRTVRLLPKGLAAAEGETAPDEGTLELLQRLAASPKKALALKTLKRLRGVTERLIKAAERRDEVEILQAEVGSVVQVKTEDVYALKTDAMVARSAFSRPGPVRDRLIDWLERFGPATASAIRDAFPRVAPQLKQLRDKELVEVTQRALRLDAAEEVEIDPNDVEPRAPTPAQATSLSALHRAIGSKTFSRFLLHGITGSGKTEVYLQAAARVLEEGGSAILLVPEIGLTPQFLARFRARFGEDPVAVLHSGLTDRERFDEWIRIRRGDAKLVIGPRSAVYAPVQNLRLIVVDEEHDGSYKQDDGLRYNARDVALVRARNADAVCVLGSATPALESLYLAETTPMVKLSMPDRVGRRRLPKVELVDLRDYPVENPDEAAAALSPPMKEAVEQNHAAGGQAILLLNRRGFATTVLCTDCGAHFRCDDCDVSMTFHARQHRILCHWCGVHRPLPNACPACESRTGLKLVGRGTERLEEEMLALWPDLRVDRMDADTTRSRSSHKRILDRFRRGDVDVLIGTQMVAKGHDFPRVTLVGVLHADAALHLPDFRASERTFQLIAQVAGRAGRGDMPGRVLVQTYHPKHHAVRLALAHDYNSFAQRELRFRRGLWYPPFARLCQFGISSQDERAAEKGSRLVREALDLASRDLVDAAGQLRILGPSPAPMYRLQGRYRWTVMLKTDGHKRMGQMLHRVAHRLREEVGRLPGRARLIVDRDPVSML
jgi:primosomal protein N' (replication factor Y) (superfamily II helicase)